VLAFCVSAHMREREIGSLAHRSDVGGAIA